ncbi:hypothetical protein VB715_13745 [Crocosphaera sp. UHCC 0190]|uniref:hypothetical protein n=1 Tax=Crocosphaera sp. UHCC 0190 TaxID=3110246 RepID=UPI002B203081|nr:hypothetical protein [Crocosphaera sp. UHCC 0190]MEA5510832.1 hypothetical protein [Crocosphaera sp. UHCC 0190]
MKAHKYTVIAPNGKKLEVIRPLSNQENQYWTGNHRGNFKVRINSVPDGLQLRMESCAYTGEGTL